MITDDAQLIEFEELYNSPCPPIPDGYKCDGEFRAPETGEYFLAAMHHNYGKALTNDGVWETAWGHRLILTKLPEQQEQKQEKYDDGGEKDQDEEAEESIKDFFKYMNGKMKKAKQEDGSKDDGSKQGDGDAKGSKKDAIKVTPKIDDAVGKCRVCSIPVRIVKTSEGKALTPADYRHCDGQNTSLFACHYPRLKSRDTDVTPYVEFFEGWK